MRIIIAGGREFNDYDLLLRTIRESMFNITTVISGGAKGSDTLGEIYAWNNDNCELEIYPADWGRYGNRAGTIRNTQMAAVADGLIAMWDGQSKGTKHMIDTAVKKELKYIFIGRY